MICSNYDHNKKFGLLKFNSGYGKFNLNSSKGYSLKIINVQTVARYCAPVWEGVGGCRQDARQLLCHREEHRQAALHAA